MRPWAAGAWTPRRCALWNRFRDNGETDLQKRLERWVDAETKRGARHETELPKQYEDKDGKCE